MNLKRIVDSFDLSYFFEGRISQEDVQDLYHYGVLEVKKPSKGSYKEIKKAAIARVEELWGEPEVNFDYGDANFDVEISPDKVTIFAS